jgi:hypothetical protein
MAKELKFVSPESEGIASEQILDFIKQVEYYKINMHSFILMRNGNVIAESYAKHFDKDFMHRIYSSSKTFVAMAVGYAITQGKMKITDKLTDLLKSYIHTEPSQRVKETTVFDCLTMSLGHTGNPNPEKPYNWLENNVNNSVDYCAPGTRFIYNSGAELMAAAIKEITGMEFLDYLRPVFDKLGMSKDIWCVKNAEGISWGGSGVIITLRDFARFGQMVLNLGEVDGEQIIDREFMKQATSVQMFNCVTNNYSPLKCGGYGYLMWIAPNAACFRGMGLQECFCFMDKGLLFACQGDTQGSGLDYADSVVYDMLKYMVYDKIGEKKVEGEAYEQLKKKMAEGIKRPMYGKPHADFEKEINGKTYILDNPNPVMGWKWFRFDFNGEEGTITYENNRGEKQIKFGLGDFKKGKFPETHYYSEKRDVPSNREMDCEAVAEWVEEKKLLLRVHIIDTNFGNTFGQFSFKGDEVTLVFNNRAEFFLEDYVGSASGRVVK